ncbi:MAG: L-ribulose-5-phosphate 4-epimerase AraD [Desulfobacterales bacterium]|jgi:L-ribulose-5-phosphate 4-epimerase
MQLNQLKKLVYQANMQLNASGLALFTFGNVSGVDRVRKLMVIKPSGVPYDSLTPDNMVCVSLETGRVVDSELNPSSDTDTHLEIYRAFGNSGGIAHSHSEFATSCAQARVAIRCMGTTHADYFCGDIPVTRELTPAETIENYEKNTGLVIVETFRGLNSSEIPAVLVANHGPFVWGPDPLDAVHNAIIVEFLAKMEINTNALNPKAPRLPQYQLEKHYRRKHGEGAYYGQPKK